MLAMAPWMNSLVRSLRGLAISSLRYPRHSATWFLAIFCAVVFAFFSASHSKLAPYIMPVMPSLAVLLAPRVAARPGAPTRAAWMMTALFTFIGAGLCISVANDGHAVAFPMVGWAVLGVAIAVLAASISARAATDTGVWVPAALGATLSAQALMMAFVHFPPAQSSKALLADVRPFIGPRTEVFSVNQYRQSIPAYLGRTVRLVHYEGEMQFGIAAAGGANYIPTLDAFAKVWQCSSDALAIVDLDVIESLRAKRLPFELRAVDGRSAVITRH
jgi:4-amino-4-deoxy-L-arabinose transferase-like glycosyltransferase